MIAEPTPAVIWFTGLPASGKSTVADWLTERLVQARLPVERLDGDAVRKLFPETGFLPEERDAHLRRIGYMASRLYQGG